MIKWFSANNLVLNLDKTSIMKFIAKNSSHSTLYIGYKEKYTEETVHTQFFNIQIDSHIKWKNHTEEMNPQLSGACYAVRLMVHTSNINSLKSIYCAYFHSTIKYEISFWGNSSNSGKIFPLQQKIIRILSLMNFIIKNQGIFPTNKSTHSINTRNKHHLHRPNACPPCFKKKYSLCWHKSFNSLPPSVTVLKNELAKFKATLRKYLHTHSFYSLDEFFMSEDDL